MDDARGASPLERRGSDLPNAMWLANVNARLWAIGNGLISKLAPADNNAPFVAIYYAVGDLANGVTTVIGGLILDRINAQGMFTTSFYLQLFLFGFAGRMLAVPLLARLIEPGAKRVRDLRL